ncbi:MAG: MarR family transcriptional regulator [Acidimicrobiales bacterium]
MTAPSDIRTLVMHGLRLKGFAEAGGVGEAVGVPEAEAKPILDQLVSDGLASYRDGKLSGFSLTKPGRAEHARLLSEELEQPGTREAIEAAYRRFLQLNAELLTVCTEWQLRDVGGESVVNDHTDAAHDAAVIAKLAALHARVEPICHELAAVLGRFGGYGPRLSAALERVQAGDTDWFTKPMIASYHTVWFEMHEDLLCTLGIERGSEGEG